MVRAGSCRSRALSSANAIPMGFRSGQKARQVEDLDPARGDGLADAGDPMGWQIVEDDDIAALEGRRQHIADVDPERIAIHRPVEDRWRGEPRQPQACDEGHRLPVAERDGIAAALADRRPAMESGHLGVDPGLIEKDQCLRVDERLGCLPQPPPRGDVGAILLGCAQRFF